MARSTKWLTILLLFLGAFSQVLVHAMKTTSKTTSTTVIATPTFAFAPQPCPCVPFGFPGPCPCLQSPFGQNNNQQQQQQLGPFNNFQQFPQGQGRPGGSQFGQFLPGMQGPPGIQGPPGRQGPQGFQGPTGTQPIRNQYGLEYDNFILGRQNGGGNNAVNGAPVRIVLNSLLNQMTTITSTLFPNSQFGPSTVTRVVYVPVSTSRALGATNSPLPLPGQQQQQAVTFYSTIISTQFLNQIGTASTRTIYIPVSTSAVQPTFNPQFPGPTQSTFSVPFPGPTNVPSTVPGSVDSALGALFGPPNGSGSNYGSGSGYGSGYGSGSGSSKGSGSGTGYVSPLSQNTQMQLGPAVPNSYSTDSKMNQLAVKPAYNDAKNEIQSPPAYNAAPKSQPHSYAAAGSNSNDALSSNILASVADLNSSLPSTDTGIVLQSNALQGSSSVDNAIASAVGNGDGVLQEQSAAVGDVASSGSHFWLNFATLFAATSAAALVM